MLQLTGVRKTFFPGTVNERVALDGIDLTLPPGDFATVIGSNGAGKSTLLNIIAGYMTPGTGRVDIDGRIVNRLSDHHRRKYTGRGFHDPMAGTAPNLNTADRRSSAYNRGKRRG